MFRNTLLLLVLLVMAAPGCSRGLINQTNEVQQTHRLYHTYVITAESSPSSGIVDRAVILVEGTYETLPGIQLSISSARGQVEKLDFDRKISDVLVDIRRIYGYVCTDVNVKLI